MAIQTGVFNSSTGNPAELNQRSFAGSILRRFPNGSAPMFALTATVGKSKAKSTTHGYFSKTMAFLSFALTAAQLVGATNLVVPTTAGMVKGMLFWNSRTLENVRITAIVDASNITVTRSFGRVAAAAMNIGDLLVNVGTAFEEGSQRPESRRLDTVYVPNYTQIFRNAWALTDTARATYAEAGISNIAENRGDCAMFHSVDIESAIIWGQAKMDASGSTPIHATQGVLDAISQYAPSNANAAGATTTFAQLVALCEPAFQSSTNLGNNKSRIGYCGSTALRVLNDIGRLSGQVTITAQTTSFGLKFTSFDFYKGTIDLVEHPLLNGLGMQKMMILMDPPALKLAYLDGRDTVSEEYAGGAKSQSGVDAAGGSLTTECAVELINPFACASITGLTAAA